MNDNNTNNNNTNNTNMDMTHLPLQTFKDIPQVNPGAKQIVALVKKNGRITGYKLSDGTIVDKNQGIEMAKQGNIQGVGIATRNGNEYLKSLPDESEGNNLNSLPSVSQDQVQNGQQGQQ